MVLLIICFFMITTCCHEILTLLDDFVENPSLGRDLSVIVIGKDFYQANRHYMGWLTNIRHEYPKEITERLDDYLRRKLGDPSKITRDSLRGAVFGIDLDQDNISIFNAKWKRYSGIPNSVDFYDERMIISGGKSIVEIDFAKGTERVFRNKIFQNLHTAFYNDDGTKIIVAVTGYDTVIEFDLEKEEIVWEWCLWDRSGFDDVYLSIHKNWKVTRFYPLLSYETKDELGRNITGQYFLIDPHEKMFQEHGLPKFYRPCHLNNAFYHSEDTLGLTCLHKNMTFLLARSTGEIQRIAYDKVYWPHGFQYQDREIPCKGYMITGTGSGSVLFLDEDFNVCLEVEIRGLDWIERTGVWEDSKIRRIEEELSEWVQFVSHLKDDIYVAVDCKRTQLVLIDLSKMEYRRIRYDEDISIQNLRIEPPHLSEKFIHYFEEKQKKRNEMLKNNHNNNNNYNIHLEQHEIEEKVKKSIHFVQILESEKQTFIDLCEGRYPSLDGFMTKEEYYCVLEDQKECGMKFFEDDNISFRHINERLEKPLVLKGVNTKLASAIENDRERDDVGLFVVKDGKKKLVGSMKVEDVWFHDQYYHSYHMFGISQDPFVFEEEEGLNRYHPGIKNIFENIPYWLIGGKLTSCNVAEIEVLSEEERRIRQNESNKRSGRRRRRKGRR